MIPPLDFPVSPAWLVPDEKFCMRLWDKYGMMPHIREHCRAVASVAVEIVNRAERKGIMPADRALSVPYALAGGLLHDLAKTYTIRHGGSHAQLGAAWVREETGNPALAQAVMWHVSWPWAGSSLDELADPLRLPVIVAYADKRVRHNEVVTLQERFDDIMVRYGVDEDKRQKIAGFFVRSQAIEQAIFDKVGAF